MIITRTPFRVSFAGGGSDLANYYENFGGAVVSTSINKYSYLSMHPYFFEKGYFLKYSDVEMVDNVDDIKHRIIREVFKLYKIQGVDLNSSSDIPAGTGLSSSSAFTAGLINLCNAYNGTYMSKEEIAEQACHVEINLLGEPGGKQDQYACACGGLNFIEFEKSGKVNIEKIYMTPEGYERLEHNLLLFYTGKTRSSGDILKEQKQNTSTNPKKIENLHKMVALAKDLREELLHNNIDAMGEILHKNWELKRELASSISNDFINANYEKALKAGAEGGKLLGAGGGGFMLFYVKEQNHQRVRQALTDLKEMPFKFENKGTTLIYYDKHSLKGEFENGGLYSGHRGLFE
jgi:D-glycero-alpha-D-manno-heptose-7-phosphate kinase